MWNWLINSPWNWTTWVIWGLSHSAISKCQLNSPRKALHTPRKRQKTSDNSYHLDTLGVIRVMCLSFVLLTFASTLFFNPILLGMLHVFWSTWRLPPPMQPSLQPPESVNLPFSCCQRVLTQLVRQGCFAVNFHRFHALWFSLILPLLCLGQKRHQNQQKPKSWRLKPENIRNIGGKTQLPASQPPQVLCEATRTKNGRNAGDLHMVFFFECWCCWISEWLKSQADFFSPTDSSGKFPLQSCGSVFNESKTTETDFRIAEDHSVVGSGPGFKI